MNKICYYIITESLSIFTIKTKSGLSDPTAWTGLESCPGESSGVPIISEILTSFERLETLFQFVLRSGSSGGILLCPHSSYMFSPRWVCGFHLQINDLIGWRNWLNKRIQHAKCCPPFPLTWLVLRGQKLECAWKFCKKKGKICLEHICINKRLYSSQVEEEDYKWTENV